MEERCIRPCGNGPRTDRENLQRRQRRQRFRPTAPPSGGTPQRHHPGPPGVPVRSSGVVIQPGFLSDQGENSLWEVGSQVRVVGWKTQLDYDPRGPDSDALGLGEGKQTGSRAQGTHETEDTGSDPTGVGGGLHVTSGDPGSCTGHNKAGGHPNIWTDISSRSGQAEREDVRHRKAHSRQRRRRGRGRLFRQGRDGDMDGPTSPPKTVKNARLRPHRSLLEQRRRGWSRGRVGHGSDPGRVLYHWPGWLQSPTGPRRSRRACLCAGYSGESASLSTRRRRQDGKRLTGPQDRCGTEGGGAGPAALTLSTGWTGEGRRTHAQPLHAQAAVLALAAAAAGVLQHLAAVAYGGRRSSEDGVLVQDLDTLGRGRRRTFKPVLAETLVLVLGAGQAVASVEAGPAVAGAAVHARPDVPALGEAVGQVHLLVVDGHLSRAAGWCPRASDASHPSLR